MKRLVTCLGLLFLLACSPNEKIVFMQVESIEALKNLSKEKKTIVITKPIFVSSSLELPAFTTVKIQKKGLLIIAPDVDLTILGTVEARADQKIFDLKSDTSLLFAPQLLVVYPHWFGAKGDGVTNDTKALRQTAEFINRHDGGTIEFLAGTYIVGAQSLATQVGKGCAYCPEDLLKFKDNLDPVILKGNGALLKAAGGLKFGSFDPVTGEPINPNLPFVDSDFTAHAYWGMIELHNNAHVEIYDFELDGNIWELELGGFFGDAGRQLAAYGVRAYNNSFVQMERIYSHHHGLDGFLIGHVGLTESDAATPHILKDVRGEYNARQGLSWVGGRGLTVQNCGFNHTGRARFATAPAAGLDIEAEDAVVRDGLFEDCEFIDNVGLAFVADSGDGGYSTFRRSLFWGTTTYAIWPNKPQLKFEDCTVYGTVVRAFQANTLEDGVSFENCYFEDIQNAEHSVFTSPAGLLELDADYLRVEDSKVVANKTRGVFLDGIFSNETLRNVTIEHKFEGLIDGDFQSLLRGVTLDNVSFLESFSDTQVKRWYIASELEDCVNAVVAGPRVRWKNPISGSLGNICL